jgi:uncharacterized protein YyaL (SSP411 family)
MLRSFAEAAAALDRDDYRQAAIRNAEFVLGTMRQPAAGPSAGAAAASAAPGQGAPTAQHTGAPGSWRLFRSSKDGQSRLNAYLEDYAAYANGLLALYEATFDLRWFAAARALAETMLAQFADDEAGGFFDTSADHETLLTRPKDLYDNATPSGNSLAVEALLRLSELTGEERFQEPAERMLRGLREALAQHPSAFGNYLCALDFALGPVQQIALVGEPDAEDTRALVRTIFGRYLPNKVVALRAPSDAQAEQAIALLADRPPKDGRATAYVCQHYTCQLPVTDPEALAAQLDAGA